MAKIKTTRVTFVTSITKLKRRSRESKSWTSLLQTSHLRKKIWKRVSNLLSISAMKHKKILLGQRSFWMKSHRETKPLRIRSQKPQTIKLLRWIRSTRWLVRSSSYVNKLIWTDNHLKDSSLRKRSSRPTSTWFKRRSKNSKTRRKLTNKQSKPCVSKRSQIEKSRTNLLSKPPNSRKSVTSSHLKQRKPTPTWCRWLKKSSWRRTWSVSWRKKISIVKQNSRPSKPCTRLSVPIVTCTLRT